MIIEFEPNKMLLSYPPTYILYYKTEYELGWNIIHITYENLQLFLERYGYESTDILLLHKFGINTKRIKYINFNDCVRHIYGQCYCYQCEPSSIYYKKITEKLPISSNIYYKKVENATIPIKDAILPSCCSC